MDSFALGYLAQRFVYRIGDFLRHWYVKSVHLYGGWIIDRFQEIDYTLAWRITAKNFFQPLYKDYSVIGYILGFFFRTGRILIASAIYLVLFTAALAVYIFWLLLPPYLVFRALFG